MIDLILGLSVLLLVAGVIGSFAPLVLGALLSIIGVSLYWWSTGFTQPSIVVVVLLYLTALTALLFDLFAGAIGSKAGGASNKTVQMAAIAGLVFFFITGPIGMIAGVTGVVLAREYLITGESKKSLKAAAYTAISVLGSAIIQGFLTGLTLIIFLAALLI